MARRLQFRRVLLLTLLLGAAFAGLGYRLVDLQVLRHEELSNVADHNTHREVLRVPRRGDILDVKGNLLATSLLVKRICADPTLIGDRYPEMARVLAPVLKLPAEALAEGLKPRVRARSTNGEPIFDQYVVLKKKVRLEDWGAVQSAVTNCAFGFDLNRLTRTNATRLRNLRQAIFAEDEQLRMYPNQSLAAHVLGYASEEVQPVNGVPVVAISGRDGIELTLDTKLAGVSGWRLIETDARKHEMVALRNQDVEPRDGLNVVLTLDSVIQHIVESVLAEAMQKHTPISISSVVIRPRTGEILALATLPDYDPGNPGAAAPEARRNRAITDIIEPGSTFKIVVVSGALNDSVVRLADVFDCERGRFAYAGRVLHDHESYGALSVKDIITKSSNIGAAKIGIQMGPARLYDYIRDFGFGVRTGLPLPGEVNGIVHPTKSWSKVSIAQIPMGQGVAVTRLQMTMAMCALANNGCLMRPMIVDRLEDRDGDLVAKYSPQRMRQVVSEPTARLMVEALKAVVSPEGTAPKAALDHYTVAGKTGTAQKVEHGEYIHGKYIASFIGFFPADNPELCISVVLDEPKEGYYGGQVAAPLFRQIAERAANYLNIRPDVDEGQLARPLPLTTPGTGRAIKTAAARPPNNPSNP